MYNLPDAHVKLLVDCVLHFANVGPAKKDAKLSYVYLDSLISKRCDAKWLLDENLPTTSALSTSFAVMR